MVRRRTATLSLSAASLLLAAPLITSCGTAHAGAAAVVGGQAISLADLQGQVKQVRSAQSDSPQSAQLISATSDLDRSTLNSMVFDKVLDRAAHDTGVSVDRGDVQRLEQSAIRQAGGRTALDQALLQRYNVAPGQAHAFFRSQAQAQGIARALHVDLSSQQGQEAVTKALTTASRRLHVDVNPRYGTWDSKTLTLGTAPEPWLRQAASTAAPTTGTPQS